MQSDALVKLDHAAVQVRSSWNGLDGILLSSWKGFNAGRHGKTPVRCPCSRLSTLHGAPWMRVLIFCEMHRSVGCLQTH